MQATVLQFRTRDPDTTPEPDPDIPVVARWLLSRGWTGQDAFHAGLPVDLAAAILILEASCPA